MSPRFVTSERPVEAAAAELTAALREAIEERGRARVAVPGGSALAAFVEAAESLPLDRLCVTWVDERCVPVGDPASNRGALHRALGGPLPTELPLWLDGESVDQALARVRAGLSQVFDDALDVTLLGMGADGHVASLFVGRGEPPGARVLHVGDSPKPPADRMTLSRAVLGATPRAILVATGENKRDPLARLRRGDEALPATGLPGLTVFTDLDLADRPLEDA